MNKLKKFFNNSFIFNSVIVIIFSTIFYAITLKRNGVAYIMNDDIAMRAIVSGIYSGTQSMNMIFSVFPFSGLLYFLYKITNVVDWYGMTLIFLNMFYLSYTIYNVVKLGKTKYQKIIYTCLLFFLISILFYGFLVELTFTTSASFIATCCLILFLLPDSKVKNLIIILGILLSFGIRPKACFMELIFFVPAVFYKNINNLKNIKKDLFFGIKLAFILLICIVTQKIITNDVTWKQYLEYNNYRSLYYDYYYKEIKKLPEDEKIELFYSAGFSDEEINMLSSYSGGIAFYVEIPKKMPKLIDECKKMGLNINPNIKSKFKYLLSTNLNRYYMIILCVLIYFSLKSKNRKKNILSIIPFILVQFSISIYLTIQGRLPDRIIIPLYFSYIVMNLFLILNLPEIKKIIKNVLCYDKALSTLCAIILFIISTQKINIYSVNTNTIENENAILEYFEKNKQNFYIYDRNSTEMFSIINKYQAKNYINKNGWTVFSPLHKQKIIKQGSESLIELIFEDNVYMVLTQNDIYKYENIQSDIKVEKIDEINGFSIYKFKK